MFTTAVLLTIAVFALLIVVRRSGQERWRAYDAAQLAPGVYVRATWHVGTQRSNEIIIEGTIDRISIGGDVWIKVGPADIRHMLREDFASADKLEYLL